jgi:hopanoid biosynthesis associated protein HpnK
MVRFRGPSKAASPRRDHKHPIAGIDQRLKRGGRLDGLIINADDFGLAPEVNEAVERAHRQGVLTSASLMVAGPAADEAVAIAKAMPGLHVGLHLVLAEGASMLPAEEIPDLVDDSGRLRRGMVGAAFRIALRGRARRQLRREIEAQFEAFRRTGLPLGHVDVHKHFHLHPIIADQIFAIGHRYGMTALRVPDESAQMPNGLASSWQVRALGPCVAFLRSKAARAGVFTADAVFGLNWSGAMTGGRLQSILAHLPPGTVEIYTHPATQDGFEGHAAGYAYTGELAALTDPATVAMVKRLGRHVGGYSDMMAPQREAGTALPAAP